MKALNIKIKYLYNSGFTLETKDRFLVFDYYKGDITFPDKKAYVFSSHNHPDHFNPEILEWQKDKADIQYILSDDISLSHGSSSIKHISVDEEIDIDNIKIKALGSTDLGVSFLVSIDEIKVFHAGDLNWWYWWDDTKEEIEIMERNFKSEIAKLKGENIDIVFFPVDPRLKHNYALGGEYIVKELEPKFFIPMHFGNKYDVCKKFAEIVKDCSTKVIEITHRGHIVEL